jgi:ABC-type uncharacterized transport system substrate-binding protein
MTFQNGRGSSGRLVSKQNSSFSFKGGEAVTALSNVRSRGKFSDRILKGAKPADLPVQAPTKFDLIINLTTAKSLGLEVPFGMQQRADALIE